MDSDDGICERCSKINFEQSFEEASYAIGEKLVLWLGQLKEWDLSSCSVCRLFCYSIRARDGSIPDLNFYLWSVSDHSLFWGVYNGPDDGPRPGSILLFVAPNQRRPSPSPMTLSEEIIKDKYSALVGMPPDSPITFFSSCICLLAFFWLRDR
jgi:hypothetical protein